MSDALREISETLADYLDTFGDAFPWPWLVDDLDEAERLAKKCIEDGKPYPVTYDDDKVY